MNQLSEKDKIALTRRHGAGWCSCVMDSVSKLTPAKLGEYCERKGFKPFPAPIYEQLDDSTRYQYLVDEVYQPIKDSDQHTKVPIVAKFGNFPAFPFNTMNSCLEAITTIAQVLKVTPKSIVEEIVGGEQA